MEVLTLKEIMSIAGVKERTARSWVAKAKEEGSYTVERGDRKWIMKATGQVNERREALYSWEQVDGPVSEVEAVAAAPAKVAGEPSKAEKELPFNELNDLRNAGTATPSQLAQWLRAVVDGGYAGYHEDKATKRLVLDSPYEWILVPGKLTAERAEVDSRIAGLADREAELEEKERRLEQREVELDMVRVDLQKVALVKKWAGDTAQFITDSAAWEEAFQQEKLPEWPIMVDIHEIMSWAELPQPKKKHTKKAKKQAVDAGMFDAEE